MLRLKYSKTNINYPKICIILVITKNSTSLLTILQTLFIYNSQSLHILLFNFNNFSFSQQYIIDNLETRLFTRRVSFIGFSEYNFRREVA